MLALAFRNLLRHKLRSALSLLGMTIAIAGMVGLFSVSAGLTEMVSASFMQIPGLSAMQPGAPIPIFSRLPASWGEEMRRVDGVGVVTPELWERVNVIDGKLIPSPPRFLLGVDLPTRLALRQPIYQPSITEGRFLEAGDADRDVCVIAAPIGEEFKKGLGDRLDLGGHPLEIVGVYESGSILLAVTIIVSAETARRISRFDTETVSSYYIEPTGDLASLTTEDRDTLASEIQDIFDGREIAVWKSSEQKAAETLQSIQSIVPLLQSRFTPTLLRGAGGETPKTEPAAPEAAAQLEAPTVLGSSRRNIEIDEIDRVDDDSPIEVRSADDWAKRFDRFSSDLDLFLLLITGIGIAVAVLSIVNTMLMSVTERIIEFGILKANGWRKLDVLKLITFESALLGFGGGVLGSLFGWVGAQVVNASFPDRIQLAATPTLMLSALLFSTLMGVLGGLYPAVWAMRLLPIDAIRRS